MTYKPLSIKTLALIVLITASFILGTNVAAQDSVPTIDGNIGIEEYTFQLSLNDGKFLLYWQSVGDQIYFAMSAETTGYVGINVDPGFILSDADLYYGFVNESGDFMVDTYSDSITGPSELDIKNGGTDDILEYSGNEIDGQTTFEFRRLLVTGDSSHDNVISLEGTLISWTTGDSDDISERPADSGRVDINFNTGDSEEVKDNTLYYIAGAVVAAIIVITIFIVWYIKKRRSKTPSE